MAQLSLTCPLSTISKEFLVLGPRGSYRHISSLSNLSPRAAADPGDTAEAGVMGDRLELMAEVSQKLTTRARGDCCQLVLPFSSVDARAPEIMQ